MRLFADLHIHSPYSRATSRALSLEMLHIWAQKKGLGLVGTGDFTHPLWQRQILEKLEPAQEEGLWVLRPDLASSIESVVPEACRGEVRFVLQTEICTIYKQGGKTRKVHHLVVLPDRLSMERLISKLERIGNLSGDGRPILGLSSRDLLEVVLDACEKAIFVAAHVWTPWFSVFGSKSGFDDLYECYGELTEYLTALETGLSSDPSMNYRWSKLDRFTLVSNSDAHSASNLGREANLLDIQPCFSQLRNAMKTGEGFLGTIEFFPEEGKYHLDGHRACGVRMEPSESVYREGLCPRCQRPVTVGVLHRVEELADRPPGSAPPGARPYWKLIPLDEILGELLQCGTSSRKVTGLYERLLIHFGPELPFLLDPPLEILKQRRLGLLAEALRRMREGKVILEPGYDGQYGNVKLFTKDELTKLRGQIPLLEIEEKKPKTHHLSISSKVGRSEDPPLRPPVDYPPRLSSSDPLDPHQLRAVQHKGKALMVIAGPGTGKTRVLAYRTARILEERGRRSGKVLALTFTQRATLEMKERLQRLLGNRGPWEDVIVQTVHAWGLGFLREYWELAGLRGAPSLADEDQRMRALEEAMAVVGKAHKGQGQSLEVISALKQGLAPEKWDSMKEILWIYDSALRVQGLVDYDDLLGLPLKVLKQNPQLLDSIGISHLLVDEFQDLNPLQVKLIESLIGPKTHFTFIGDPDQSIYGFRGAAPNAMIAVARKTQGMEVIVLPTNYRCKGEIVDGAAALISHNEPFFRRTLLPHREPGEGIRVAFFQSRRQEAIFVAHEIERLIGGTTHWSMLFGGHDDEGERMGLGFGDFAVLARVHNLLTEVQEVLLKQGIPCQRWDSSEGIGPSQGEKMYKCLRWLLEENVLPGPRGWEPPAEIRELRGSLGRWDVASLVSHVFRIITGYDPQGPFSAGSIDSKAIRILDSAKAWGKDLREFVDYWSLILQEAQPLPQGDEVSLMTVHGAKGLEFSVVFIVGCEEGIFPWRPNASDTNVEEERRLFYVAMTRAREILYLTGVKDPSPTQALGGKKTSRFILEIPQRDLIAVNPKLKFPGPRQLSLF